MCCCGNMGVEWIPKIRVRTDPGEENSRRFCRDLNLQPFNHESGALTTELSCSPSCCDGPYKDLILILTSPDLALVQVPVNHQNNTSC